MSDQTEFTHNLIKGKIAETIFEMMFRETDKFTLLRFGYEYTEPILAQYRNRLKIKKVLDNVSNAPDFILLTEDKTEAYIVEVKYRNNIGARDIYKIAYNAHKIWNFSWLFIVSGNGFYFGSTNKIVKDGGKISPLRDSWIDEKIQRKYLGLANHFLRPHEKEYKYVPYPSDPA